MALSLTPNTTGKTGRAMERVPRRLFQPHGQVRQDQVHALRDCVAAGLHADGIAVWKIAAVLCVEVRAVHLMIGRHRGRFGAN